MYLDSCDESLWFFFLHYREAPPGTWYLSIGCTGIYIYIYNMNIYFSLYIYTYIYSLCTQSICCLPVAQGNIQQVSYRTWFNIRPTVVYPGTMYSALFLFALSYGATAPATTDQTTLLLLDSENAAASFTPPYMFGSTAVFPAMFQLGSGAGGDSEVICSLVSLDPLPS